MKNVFKNPLKVIVAGMFVAAMGFGMSTSLKISESNEDVSLLTLSSAVAQGESSESKCNYKKVRNGVTICKGSGTITC